MAKKRPTGPIPVEVYKHTGDTRVNIPTEELRDFVAADERAPATQRYPRDPSLDPQLVWKGKDNKESKGASTVDKELVVASEMLAVVDKARYPQVRPLYRFNYTTGAVFSFVKDPSFTKVKVATDDPATVPKEADRYRIAEDTGESRLMPAFLFTVNWARVDTQQPVFKRYGGMFAPTIGFSLTSPADNFFAGFTFEFIESTQLFIGCNWSKVKRLARERDVDELSNDKAPLTRTVRENGLVLGVSFNINLITSIFK